MIPARRQLNAWLAGGAAGVLLAVGAHSIHSTATNRGARVTLTESMGGGLHGYIAMKVSAPPAGFGVSFYAAAWPPLATPLKSFQIGLPSAWIIPDNRGDEQPLCPHGTLARDHWPERGPSFRDVFQTIEGGMGFWVSTQFPSATPKFRMNGTPDCYNDEISSPGWGFYATALSSDKMGLVELSNRLVIPPDGLTFKQGVDGELFGTAWMALPLMGAHWAYHRWPTGDKSWTLFLSAQNFKGPVAFWIPDTWSRIARNYPPAAGRTLDTRPGIMGEGAMEVNTVPYFSNQDSHGVLYSRIPKLQFPIDAEHETVLMQDVRVYSRAALYNSVKEWTDSSRAASGTFDPRGELTPSCKILPLKFDEHGVPLTGFGAFVETTMIGPSGSCSFGLKWKRPAAGFPQYFKQDGAKMVAVPASQVPPDTGLAGQTFAPAVVGKPYNSPGGSDNEWSKPGPKSGPFSIVLEDGSRVTYCWYRFVDQPALQHLHLSKGEQARLQALVVRIETNWPITRNYMPHPSGGTLARLDPALIVTPPRGMETGYVPIVTRQEQRPDSDTRALIR